jgi:hypothetical protein
MNHFPILVALSFAVLPVAALAQTQPAQPTTPPAAGQTPAPPAQPAPPPPPSPEVTAIQQAGTAFGQCIQTGVGSVPATATPEAGATRVVNGCSTHRQALEAAAQALIATLPEAERAGAQEQVRSQLGAVEGQVAAGIRQMRGTAAPAPAPAPAPSH